MLYNTLLAFAFTGILTCAVFLGVILIREAWYIVKARRQFNRSINRYILGGK